MQNSGNKPPFSGHCTQYAHKSTYYIEPYPAPEKCCDNPKLSNIDTLPAIIYCGNCKHTSIEE